MSMPRGLPALPVARPAVRRAARATAGGRRLRAGWSRLAAAASFGAGFAAAPPILVLVGPGLRLTATSVGLGALADALDRSSLATPTAAGAVDRSAPTRRPKASGHLGARAGDPGRPAAHVDAGPGRSGALTSPPGDSGADRGSPPGAAPEGVFPAGPTVRGYRPDPDDLPGAGSPWLMEPGRASTAPLPARAAGPLSGDAASRDATGRLWPAAPPSRPGVVVAPGGSPAGATPGPTAGIVAAAALAVPAGADGGSPGDGIAAASDRTGSGNRGLAELVQRWQDAVPQTSSGMVSPAVASMVEADAAWRDAGDAVRTKPWADAGPGSVGHAGRWTDAGSGVAGDAERANHRADAGSSWAGAAERAGRWADAWPENAGDPGWQADAGSSWAGAAERAGRWADALEDAVEALLLREAERYGLDAGAP